MSTQFFFDDGDDDNDATKGTETGDYNLGDDIGERIGEDTSSEDSAL